MTLHWLEDGPVNAPALVLLNSIGTSTEMWTPVVGVLAEQFHVVRIDHRGHGSSPASPAGTTCTIADLGADVLAVLDELDLQRVHLAGVSLGGMVGMWLAAHRPERVGRLALLCTSAHLAAAQQWRERAATVRVAGMSPIVEAVTARWVTPELAARDGELMNALREMMRSVDAESYAQCCDAIAVLDLRPDLARISAPTLVVSAAQDLAIPAQHGEFVAECINGARFELLDGAAHIATVEQSGRIAAMLLEHLRGGATLARGYATRREVLGDEHVDRSVANRTELTAAFQEFLTRYAWGDVWSRPELSREQRSIATLAALTALGAEHELAMHVRAALRNGLSAEQIVEVLMHTSLYAGLPRANRAVAIAQNVLEQK